MFDNVLPSYAKRLLEINNITDKRIPSPYTHFMDKIINYIKRWLLDFTIIQLFLTLVSLPVIVAWGLPISILSPIGNLIFSPFLTAFLLISSLLFFTEILYIPNTWLVWALETVTTLWKQILDIPLKDCLFAFKQPPMILLIILGIAPFIVVIHPAMKTSLQKLYGLIVLFFISWFLLALNTKNNGIYPIACHNNFITVAHTHNKTVIIDPGYLGKRISAPSYVAFTLVPELIKQSGSLVIDHCIITTIGSVLFQAVETLNDKMEIKHLYLAYIDGEWDPIVRKHFNRMYAKLRHNNVIIHSVKTHPLTIADDGINLTITPGKNKQYKNLHYPEITITGFIDNKILNIYDAKGSPS
jgi:Competence protein.